MKSELEWARAAELGVGPPTRQEWNSFDELQHMPLIGQPSAVPAGPGDAHHRSEHLSPPGTPNPPAADTKYGQAQKDEHRAPGDADQPFDSRRKAAD